MTTMTLSESDMSRILKAISPRAFNFQIELNDGDATELLAMLSEEIIEMGKVAEATELHTIVNYIARETKTEWFLEQNYPGLINREKW